MDRRLKKESFNNYSYYQKNIFDELTGKKIDENKNKKIEKLAKNYLVKIRKNLKKNIKIYLLK